MLRVVFVGGPTAGRRLNIAIRRWAYAALHGLGWVECGASPASAGEFLVTQQVAPARVGLFGVWLS